MKKFMLLFLLSSIFLTGCDVFSKFFKKTIEAIEADGVVFVYPEEEFILHLSTVPDKGTVPEWAFEYPEKVEVTTTLVDSVTKKRRYTITAKEVGDYNLIVSEKESKLNKTIVVKCRYKLTDFSLPEVKVVRLGQEFDFSKDFVFEPSEMITYDFEYTFDSNLIKYQEKTKLFLANANDKGDLPIIVKDKKSGITKVIKIKVVDKFKIFEQFKVALGLKKELPSDLLQYVEENNLKVKLKGEGLTLTNDLKVIANKEGNWDLLLYEQFDGEEVEWGKINILCSSWLLIEFYYRQRIKKDVHATMLEIGLEEQLKSSNTFSFRYYWYGMNVGILNAVDTSAFKEAFGNPLGAFDYTWMDKKINGCLNHGGGAVRKIKASGLFDTTVEISRSGLSYNSIISDINLQNSFKKREYKTKIEYTEATLSSFRKIKSCHNDDGSDFSSTPNVETDGLGKAHYFYIYPYIEVNQFHLLKEKMDQYIGFAKTKAKENFAKNVAHTVHWELEGGNKEQTSGEFKIRKNQDNKIYSIVNDTNHKNHVVSIPTYSQGNYEFSHITNDLHQLNVFKTERFEIEPLYPVVDKIIIEWDNDDVIFESIQWQLPQEILTKLKKEEIYDSIDNKKITLTFNVKDLANDDSILKGTLCFVRFKNKEGLPVIKEIKVIKED